MTHPWFRRVVISVLAVNLGETEMGWAQVARPQQSLVDRIHARFKESKLKDDRIIVKVEDDAVILEGRTQVVQHKGVATRLARSAGAKHVVNRIEVVEAEPVMAPVEMRRAIVKRVN